MTPESPENIDKDEEEIRRLIMRKILRKASSKIKEPRRTKSVIEIENVHQFDEYLRRATNEDKVVFVDFWAPWCMPCIMMAPIYEEVAKQYLDKAYFLKVNVDKVPELAERYQIMSIPTLIAFWREEPVDIRIGAIPKASFESWVKSVISKVS